MRSPRDCDRRDIALKGFFLGPRAENGPWIRSLLDETLEQWFEWRRSLFPGDGRAISEADLATPELIERRERFSRTLAELMRRFEGEVPKFSPRYIGHMFSEVSLPALLGHIATLLHNPNNISGESSRVGVKLENEAVESLCAMVGFPGGHGHFTSGGTVANFEALIRARSRCALWLAAGAAARAAGRAGAPARIFEAAHLGWERFDALGGAGPRWNFVEGNPWETGPLLSTAFGEAFRGPVVLVPRNKHYSWVKGVSLLGLGEEAFWSVELDSSGKLSIPHLRETLSRARREARPVLLVVSVAGTTELGAIDPIDGVQDVLDEWRNREGIHVAHHVDAAYGGFFRALDLGRDTVIAEAPARALLAISRADSVTLDPHKLGYVPYSSGAFLCRSARDYAGGKAFTGPYVQFDLGEDKGPYTLEGSRSAAGAVATWMTARCIGFDPEGYGRILSRTIQIKLRLEAALASGALPVHPAPGTDTNILCFAIARPGAPVSSANALAERVFEAFSPRGNGPFFVSKTRLERATCGALFDRLVSKWQGRTDTDSLVLVRLCLMNPFFGSKETRVDFTSELVRELGALLT